ncbi:MAG TPA: flagellar hook-associated protein FlgK [Kofleriaceae bacterium]
MGSQAIAAQNSGVAVATNNVANVNTQGYSRERVDLDALVGPPTEGGVKSGTPTRVASDLLSTRIRASAGSLAASQTTSDGLADVEAQLASGPSIGDQLGAVFAKLSQVSAAPTDPTGRDAAVAALGSLASTIRGQASTIAGATTDADKQVATIVGQANTIATQLAAANKAAQSGDPTAADQRDQLATQLSQLVGGSARIDADGQMRFVLDGGAVLVDGTQAAQLGATPDATTGHTNVTFGSGASARDITSELGGGQLGGTLATRSQLVGLAGQYDQYAYDLANGFNAASSANAGLDGVTGRNTFTPPPTVAGAALSLAVDPALAADSSKLATAAAGAGPGDNTGALALGALASSKVASGNTSTLGDAGIGLLASLGSAAAGAKSNATADAAVDSHLGDLRDSLSGVDVTEEQANLAKFTSASQALTKFVSTINDLLSTFIENI